MFGRLKIPSITASELKELLTQESPITLLDVRTPEEWAHTGIIPGSITVSLQSLEAELNRGLNFKDRGLVVVICKSGARSGSVVKYFVSKLNIDAKNLEGGVIAWDRIKGKFEQISS